MVDSQDYERLDRARLQVGLSIEGLWIRYFELGGSGSVVEVEAFLKGALVPPRSERDMLAHAINEASREKGGSDLVPYLFSDEVDPG